MTTFPKNELPTLIFAFHSPLGGMAVAMRADLLCRLTFGHRLLADARDVLLELCSANGGPVSAVSAPLPQLAERLQAYAEGNADDFLDVPLDERHLRDFSRRVIARCRRILPGTTLTYAELATEAGFPGAARAVGNVMARNRVPIVVPCHRVVGSQGKLGGYSAPGGLDLKKRLLDLESRRPQT